MLNELDHLIVCHDCDALHRFGPLLNGQKACCVRCGAVLYRGRRNGIEQTIAISVAALILFVCANAFPFMTMEIGGRFETNSLASGVMALYAKGMWPLALLVLLTTMVVPAFRILATLYVLVPLYLGYQAGHAAPVFRFSQVMTPWGMLEVYLLGVLVAITKLATMAVIEPGIALYAFALVVLLLAATQMTLEPRDVWDKISA